MPLTLGGPEQGSRVPLATTPSLKKVPAWLGKTEVGVLPLQATQVVERSFSGAPFLLPWDPRWPSEELCPEHRGVEKLEIRLKVEARGEIQRVEVAQTHELSGRPVLFRSAWLRL